MMNQNDNLTLNTPFNHTQHIKLGVMGLGKLGTTLAGAIAQSYVQHQHTARFSLQGVYSSQLAHSAACAQLFATTAYEHPQNLINACDWVILAVPDTHIADVCRGLTWQAGQWALHCSGATDLSALSHAATFGAECAGFHPLKTFAEKPNLLQSMPAHSLQALQGCAVGIELMHADFLSHTQASELAHQSQRAAQNTACLAALAQQLGMRSMLIPAGQRAIYHASANYAGAFIPAVLQEAVTLWQTMGLDQEQALSALLPLLRSTVDACYQSVEHPLGLANATVGPIARGDTATVTSHVQALTKYPAHLKLYTQLSEKVIALSMRRGTLNDAKAQAIAQVLNQHAT